MNNREILTVESLIRKNIDSRMFLGKSEWKIRQIAKAVFKNCS